VFFHSEPHYTPVYNRAALVPGDCFSGPAIITEYSSATILPPGDRLRVDALDNLLIEVH
jgi:N-methylhydantoinase A